MPCLCCREPTDFKEILRVSVPHFDANGEAVHPAVVLNHFEHPLMVVRRVGSEVVSLHFVFHDLFKVDHSFSQPDHGEVCGRDLNHRFKPCLHFKEENR